MANLVTQQYTLNGTPQLVTTRHNQGADVIFHNSTKQSNNKIYIGGSAVTVLTGLHLDADQFIQLTLAPELQIWAISDPAGLVLEVMEQRY